MPSILDSLLARVRSFRWVVVLAQSSGVVLSMSFAMRRAVSGPVTSSEHITVAAAQESVLLVAATQWSGQAGPGSAVATTVGLGEALVKEVVELSAQKARLEVAQQAAVAVLLRRSSASSSRRSARSALSGCTSGLRGRSRSRNCATQSS